MYPSRYAKAKKAEMSAIEIPAGVLSNRRIGTLCFVKQPIKGAAIMTTITDDTIKNPVGVVCKCIRAI